MASIAFTVRNNTSGSAGGSYLRYPDGSASPGIFPVRPDYDSALHGNVQAVPSSNVTFTTSTFTAIPVSYQEIDLQWGVQFFTPSAIPSATSALLVYSNRGVPQTVLSGTVLVESNTASTYKHTGLPSGQWAYYGLFVHFTTSPNTSDYYQKVAELEVLVPTDYGSTLRLWDQIPAYYKTADIQLANAQIAAGTYIDPTSVLGQTHGDSIGPLYKFLSIFGFDLDNMRTLIDYVMVAKDPEVANSETLDSIANTLGLPLDIVHLGDTRLRSLLDDIGTFRRSKGTATAVNLFTNAITGSNLVLNPVTKKYTLYSQRANYVTIPKAPSTGNIVSWRVANAVEVTAPQAFSYTGYNAASAGGSDITYVDATQTWTRNSSAHNILGAMVKLSSPVPVLLGDLVEFSIHSSTPTNLVWARITNGSNVLGWATTTRTINGVDYCEIQVTANANATTFTNATVEFLVDCSGGAFIGQNYLCEVNHIGDYFDGNTVRGGWLVDSSSISDFRWSGSTNNSVSIYSEDYSRTVGVIKSLFASTLPITVDTTYAITVFNGIRGF